MEKRDIALLVLDILEATNENLFKAFATAKEGEIRVHLQQGRKGDYFLSYPTPLFDLYPDSKDIYFYTSPQTYLSEKACIKAVEELRKEGFSVRGAISFVENPECTI